MYIYVKDILWCKMCVKTVQIFYLSVRTIRVPKRKRLRWDKCLWIFFYIEHMYIQFQLNKRHEGNWRPCLSFSSFAYIRLEWLCILKYSKYKDIFMILMKWNFHLYFKLFISLIGDYNCCCSYDGSWHCKYFFINVYN